MGLVLCEQYALDVNGKHYTVKINSYEERKYSGWWPFPKKERFYTVAVSAPDGEGFSTEYDKHPTRKDVTDFILDTSE